MDGYEHARENMKRVKSVESARVEQKLNLRWKIWNDQRTSLKHFAGRDLELQHNGVSARRCFVSQIRIQQENVFGKVMHQTGLFVYTG